MFGLNVFDVGGRWAFEMIFASAFAFFLFKANYCP